MANKRKQPPPTKTTPQTTGLGSPNPAATKIASAMLMRGLAGMIPAGGPVAGGDATQIKSETGKKARGKR
jgi:hypothetical protein